MKSMFRILGLAAVLTFVPTVHAASVTYDFTATGMSYIPQLGPGTGSLTPPISSVSGSFTVDGTTVTNINLQLGSFTYLLSDVGFVSFYPFGALGSNENGPDTIGSSTNDFILTADFSATPSFGTFVYTVDSSDRYWGSDTGTISVRNDVPEPASLALFGAALAGLGLTRRKAKQE